MNPFKTYFDRYQSILNDCDANLQEGRLVAFLETSPSQLNNLFMAGLGMGTLFLRYGAVIQLCDKLHDGDTNNDALFMKQVMDNLRETLPSDTNWKNLWYASMHEESDWQKSLPRDNGKNTILDRFVTFRNKFVHQYIRLIPEHAQELQKGLHVLAEMAGLYAFFEGSSIDYTDNKYYWIKKGKRLELHPFVQAGEQEGLPYLFQGLYDNKTKAKFINAFYGDETIPAANQPLDDHFQPMQQALKGGAGQVFDHSERMQYYRECFVGRDREVQAVMDWVSGESTNTVLPIYSEAGMGKGALLVGIIDQLMAANIPVMYHFCGSGMANSLHAVLYHFILQGKKMPGMNGAGVWKIDNETLQRKMERLPSRYHDAIRLFQTLLTECYSPTTKYKNKPLVIVIDGLDEAAVANSQLKIADWFYTYNEKDEIEDDWKSPDQVKWIFTYRSLPGVSGKGFQLNGRFQIENNALLQPLNGLAEDAVREALKIFELSEEFIQTVMKNGNVSE
ncbi:MAG: hypothetical protein ACU4F9_06125 [Arcticibacter sp.]